jgi:phosphate transport system permease protein
MSNAVVVGTVAVTAALIAVLFLVTPMGGVADYAVLTIVVAVLAVTAVSFRLEGRRRAVNRLATMAAWMAFLLAIAPLVAVIGYTVAKGVKRLTPNFLTHSMAGLGPFDAGGGIYHAIVGTVEQVLLASVISVPLGLLVAIYVTEYGRGPLAGAIRFFVDVMTGIPSIVAGLFVLAFWVLGLHRGFSGFAAAMSLAVIMLPIVVRASEEMIRLVPNTLREASYALGVPKWRTILRIVLPTAASGLTTGVMLAVARVTGETAPVLLTAGGWNYIHTNPFSGPQSSLPLYVFDQASQAPAVAIDRAWASALTLILIVVVLYVLARLVTRRSTLRQR